MYKPLMLTAALIPLLAEISVSHPVAAQTTNSLVDNTEMGVPLCYMQTADGRLLRLDRLCKKKSLATVTPTSSSSEGKGSSEAQCYPPDAPECISSKFDAPPPPAFTPSETPAPSQN